MGAIIDGIKSILDFFTLLVQFVVTLIDGSFQLLRAVPNALRVLLQSIALLPPAITIFASAAITIMIVFLIVGRNHE